ncbi:MAG: hypothetical protein JEZ12_16125 [Desulfobacterium sp.]|nr:hypothetical protein [Desulfobacterium sp.]
MSSPFLGLQIVPQPNGKFAIYERDAKEFCAIDIRSAEEAKDYILRKMVAILSENVSDLNNNNIPDLKLFDDRLEECRKSLGLPPKAALEELSFLKKMGVSVEETKRDLLAPSSEEFLKEVFPRTENEKNLKILEMAKELVISSGGLSSIEEIYKNLRDLVQGHAKRDID